MEFLTLDQLSFEGASLGPIAGIQVWGRPGEHGILKITAQVKEEDEERILWGLISRQLGKLYGKGHLLFAGLLSQMDFLKKDQVRLVVLTYRTASCLMDVEKKSRSFQDTSMTYRQLLETVLEDYPDSDFILAFPDEPIGQLFVQYRETDWEFLKRVFSQKYAPIAPLMGQEGIRIYVGVPELKGEWECQLEGVGKSEAEVRLFSALGASEADFVDYEVQSGSCQELFAALDASGASLSVRALDWELKKGRLECRYTLRGRSGIGAYPVYPVSLVGIALEGRILEVKGNLVRIHMDIDIPGSGKDVYWFPYATMSASLNGSGWYYMPEQGDRVRVEFPDKYASDALVINSASVYEAGGGKKDSMASPAVKYLSNQAGQKMALGPQGVAVSAGSSGITVDNGGAVILWGSNEILVKAEEKISFSAEQITMRAASQLKAANESGTGAKLESNLNLTGSEALIN